MSSHLVWPVVPSESCFLLYLPRDFVTAPPLDHCSQNGNWLSCQLLKVHCDLWDEVVGRGVPDQLAD